MSIRRSKLEIITIILDAIKNGEQKPTRIMYAANMSWNPTQKLLEDLVEKGFLKVKLVSGGKRTKRVYYITEKGENVINYFEGAKTLIQI